MNLLLFQLLRLCPAGWANVPDKYGKYPLHIVANGSSQPSTARRGMAFMLLEHEADINATRGRGKTPAHQAASTGNEQVLEALLMHRADPNAEDWDGCTPLSEAMKCGGKVC